MSRTNELLNRIDIVTFTVNLAPAIKSFIVEVLFHFLLVINNCHSEWSGTWCEHTTGYTQGQRRSLKKRVSLRVQLVSDMKNCSSQNESLRIALKD